MSVSSIGGSSAMSWYSSLYSAANGGHTGPVDVSSASSSGTALSSLMGSDNGGPTSAFRNIMAQYHSYNTMDKAGIFTRFANLTRSSGNSHINSTATVETKSADITKTSAYQNAVAAYRAGAMNPNTSTLVSGLIASINI